jgi:pyruvate-ferredoxin/flavodoxin oxidoreductase
LLSQYADRIGEELVYSILDADQSSEAGIKAQRERITLVKQSLQNLEEAGTSRVQTLLGLLDVLVRKSV